MNQRKDVSNRGAVFFVRLIMITVINYFGSLFVYNQVEIYFVVDILLALAAAITFYFRSVNRRIDVLEQRIKSLEFQFQKR